MACGATVVLKRGPCPSDSCFQTLMTAKNYFTWMIRLFRKVHVLHIVKRMSQELSAEAAEFLRGISCETGKARQFAALGFGHVRKRNPAGKSGDRVGGGVGRVYDAHVLRCHFVEHRLE